MKALYEKAFRKEVGSASLMRTGDLEKNGNCSMCTGKPGMEIQDGVYIEILTVSA